MIPWVDERSGLIVSALLIITQCFVITLVAPTCIVIEFFSKKLSAARGALVCYAVDGLHKHG